MSIRRTKLSNGITVLTESMPHLRSVSVGVWLKTGSRHEPKPYAGLYHFIEHMVFKGTETRSARDIAVAIDSIGGSFDAFTSKETTCFYFRVLDEHLRVALDLVADIVLHPVFRKEDMDKERGVIAEEIRMSQDDPSDQVFELFADAMYGDTPMGRPIAGTFGTIARIDRRRLSGHFHSAYTPSNMVIALAGKLDHGRTAEMLEKRFAGLKAPRLRTPAGHRPRVHYRQAQKRKNGVEQAHIVLGTAGLDARDKDRYPLHLVNAILGDGISSRLFQHVREEAGLAYSVYSFFQSYSDTGYFAAYAGVNPKHAKRALAMLVKELREMGKNGVTKEEFHRAKEHLKGGMMLANESSSSRMTRLAMGEIVSGRTETLDETLRRVDLITRDDAARVARRVLGGGRFTLSVFGGKNLGRLRLEDAL
jgi:predicted Zn-dependent peptidase